MCYYDVQTKSICCTDNANKIYVVQTMQTKSTMYKQRKQNLRDFAKKVLVIKLDPPKILRNRRACPNLFHNFPYSQKMF